MDARPIRFIDEQIEVSFNQPPVLEKSPPCPDGFVWGDRAYRVAEMLEEWADYTRRGKYARNMTPGHAAAASRRGSWGVGRFYFRVRVGTGQVFDLYYDRGVKNAGDRLGHWFLYREMESA